MKLLQQSFNNQIKIQLKEALSLELVQSFGFPRLKEFSEKNPDTGTFALRQHMKLPESAPFITNISHSEAVKIVENHTNLVFEIFHSNLIQKWFTYLGDVFFLLISDNLLKKASFKIPEIKIDFSFVDIGDSSLAETIRSQIVESFEYLSAEKKWDYLRRSLALEDPEIREKYQIIKREIIIRNLIQHNMGVVRPEDLKKAGVNCFTSDEGGSTTAFKENSRIRRGIFDLENLVYAMEMVSLKITEKYEGYGKN